MGLGRRTAESCPSHRRQPARTESSPSPPVQLGADSRSPECCQPARYEGGALSRAPTFLLERGRWQSAFGAVRLSRRSEYLNWRMWRTLAASLKALLIYI